MKKYLIIAASLLVLSGCASADASGREPEDTVLAQVIGVDVDGQGVSVTAAGEDGESTALVSAWADTLEGAFAALPTAGDKYISLTNVTHILVGDGVDVMALMDYVLNDPDMSWSARVWAVNGFAGGLMGELREDGLGRFEALEQGGAGTSDVKTVLAGLLEKKSAALPVLALRGGELEAAGNLYFEVR